MKANPERWLKRRVFQLVRRFSICGIIGVALVASVRAATDDAAGTIFKLREVSAFTRQQDSFLRGQICRCQDTPFSEVKGYPEFNSKAPVFGSIRFGGRANDTNSGVAFFFALDESKGTGKGFDRLYFDINRDLDLRNDAVARPQKSPPDGGYAPNFAGIKEKAAFDFLKLNLGAGSDSNRLVEVMPRLMITGTDKSRYSYVFFVRTYLLEGDIRIAGEKFHVSLGNDYVVTPGFDAPGVALKLSGEKASFDWWGGDRLSAIHKVKGRFFSFSATPSGDELTVQPYRGEMGTFEIGTGGRQLTNLSVSGSCEARDWAVPVGGDIEGGRPSPAGSCQLPVGDYLPVYLTIQLGRLKVDVSQNYHSDGKRQDRQGQPAVYGMPVRKDKAFVMDFSNKPGVMFASPAKDQRVKAGDELSVMAVLVDPKLDFMIRRLDDTSRKQTKDKDGKPLGYERNFSLDPTVIITRANGDKVAEGVMPFG